MTNADKSLGSVGENGGNGEGGQNPMQFNINLDPDLLSKLGIKTGLEGINSNGGVITQMEEAPKHIIAV